MCLSEDQGKREGRKRTCALTKSTDGIDSHHSAFRGGGLRRDRKAGRLLPGTLKARCPGSRVKSMHRRGSSDAASHGQMEIFSISSFQIIFKMAILDIYARKPETEEFQ